MKVISDGLAQGSRDGCCGLNTRRSAFIHACKKNRPSGDFFAAVIIPTEAGMIGR
ncbi:hypothetical protein UCMB321_2600 [Pseudomonas batumici]|uniref:Uncharacterized protein n=1 Tax=Pseudomonas batumici TaxID=226910 RepID=A0A0C2I3A4_9PSED|nr:hypothetical protein UCMB321_2600 [Pseudomonas batumici]